MPILKRVRVIKKIQQDGARRFVSLKRTGKRYVWDPRPGTYYLEWWNGRQRLREVAGDTPSQAIAAQRRKQIELAGGAREEPHVKPLVEEKPKSSTPIADAKVMFLAHIQAHSPDKPETVRRYHQVLDHFERLIGPGKHVEAITRADIDDYKIHRQQEQSLRHKRLITPPTINFEVSTLRTFFYYLINERAVKTDNPCARFKHLRDAKNKAGRRPPTSNQAQLDALFTHTDEFEKAVFATLLLTGLRKRELYFLTWRDVDLTAATLRVSGEGKIGFSPKDYEERVIPLPPDLVDLLSGLPERADWVFPNRNGNRLNHLLRRLQSIATRAGIAGATLHKFRHTYGTRLLERGADIVTVQKLMGHSDLKTTEKYLNPEDGLKRKAVNRLSLGSPQESSAPEKKSPAREEGPEPASKRQVKA
jgi:integrase/recombinase XerD